MNVQRFNTDHTDAEGLVSVELHLDSSGNWTGPYALPATLAPGSYLLDATCLAGRNFNAFYPDKAITVLAPDVALPGTR